MRHLVLSAGLLLFTPAALAQAVTRPVVTVSAGVLRSSETYDEQGNTNDAMLQSRSFSVSFGAEVPVWNRRGTTVSAGATLVAASYELRLEDDGGALLDGRLRPQRLDAFGRVGNARASALLGVSLNVGRDLYDVDYAATVEETGLFDVNSDGQHAAVAQVRGAYPLGRARVTGQVDAALTFASRAAVPVLDVGNPDAPFMLVDLEVDNGSPLSARLGVDVPVGPVVLGLAGFYASRSEGTVRFVDGVPPGFPPGYPAEQPNQFGYRRAVGLIPSVTVRTPDRRVTVRAEGSFSDLYAMENAPVGITLAGTSGFVTRPALTVSASVGL